MAKHNVNTIEVENIATGKKMFLSFTSWAKHRAIEKESGTKMYRIIKTSQVQTNSTAPTKRAAYLPIDYTQPRSAPVYEPPKKRKKKNCNC